jgi:sugar lactone lactonase YvrE
MTTAPVSVCNAGATLGEGPVWADHALWFVDIKRRRVHRFDPANGCLRGWDAPEQIGWVLPAAEGGMVAGVRGGLYRFDPKCGSFSLIIEVEADRPQNRLNDAATDPYGRIWFGSMDDSEQQATGRFYCFEAGQLTPAPLPEIGITNGPAISPDGRTLYHVDTLGGLIHACALNHDGSLGDSRLFACIDPGEGYPDGPTVDSEGCLWIGLFAGAQARRYAPSGELLETVRFPVSNITKLAFGGADMRTVYATTARLHLSPEELERQPEAGNIFVFRADVPGVAVTPAKLSQDQLA